MLIARSTCSGPGEGLGNEAPRSPGEQTCEPQRKRIRFGLDTQLSTASLPEMVKPVTLPEATSVCREGVDRGDWEQRARKDTPRNLGDPFGWERSQRRLRMHKKRSARSEVGRVHSSDEACNERLAKGRGCRSALIGARSSA